MVATLGGLLALPLGLLILLLPLLATELSRPRDSAWGAVLLLLALVLVTSADRLSGAPMLGVVCAALLLGRLGVEVGLGRWRQLTPEEQRRLASLERWTTSFSQLGATLADASRQLGTAAARLGQGLGNASARGTAPVAEAPAGRAGGRGKLWVRPEAPQTPPDVAGPEPEPPSDPQSPRPAAASPAADEDSPGGTGDARTAAASPPPAPETEPATGPAAASAEAPESPAGAQPAAEPPEPGPAADAPRPEPPAEPDATQT